MKRHLASLSLALLLSAAPFVRADTEAAGTQGAAAPTAQSLTPETLYLLLLAEIAGARGEIGVSLDAYARLARSTEDARIAKRATEIALFARDFAMAAETAKIWARLEPKSEEARKILASVLAGEGDRLDEVQIELARILATHPEQLEQHLLGLNRALARLPDKAVVYAIVERLTAPYLHEPSAQFALAQAALGVDDKGQAYRRLDEALAKRPGWEPAVLLRAQLLIQDERADEASTQLGDALARKPDDANLRLAYARALVANQRLAESREQFQRLLDANPGDRDMLFAVALLSFQLGDLDRAYDLFEKTLVAGHPEADGIRLNLGNIAERRQDDSAALRWYHQVMPGRQYVDALTRIAVILARGGQLDAARMRLSQAEVDANGRKRLQIVEAGLLRDADRAPEALSLLEGILSASPDDAELLYETAMMAERAHQVEAMERHLRRLMTLQPDHAHAYNALGYSLADRGLKLDEAEALVMRALELQPNDPYIMDSVGWVRFRRGDAAGALPHLEKAHGLRADPEIAAHLGEVLWVLGRTSDARKVWDAALVEDPKNRVLNETIRRLTGK